MGHLFLFVCLLVTGSYVGGGGVHVLLLPDGLGELPPAAGPAGLVRPGGRASDAGCCQEAEAGRVRDHGGRLYELHLAGVLRGRHAACLSGAPLLFILQRLSNDYFQQHFSSP